MPLLTWKYPASRRPLKNLHTAFMHVSCNPKAEVDTNAPDSASFGWTPAVQDHEAGTRLVASATMEHLSPETIDVFGDFCQWHLTPYFQAYDDQGGDSKAPAGSVKLSGSVLGEITKAKWAQYLAQWKSEKEDAAAAEACDVLEHALWKASSGLERMGLTQEDSWRLRSVLDRGLSRQTLLRFGFSSSENPPESESCESEI